MSSVQRLQTYSLSEEEYLANEQVSEIRHEFVDGQIYAMAGAGYNHNCISANVSSSFINHLRGTPCATFIADMKVRLGKDYVYPDVLVDCGKMSGDDIFANSPVIIVEVLSPSTRKTDTTTKLIRYLNLPSLQEYVLIEQDFVSVQVLRRSQPWQPDYFYLGDTVTFASIGLTLKVEDIYDRVDNKDMAEFRQQQALSGDPEVETTINQ
jgi:Uma2 family endonuclease